ncbi:hypothetical protein CHS0354_001212 [Potamilus streckersoni]|uniref:NAD(P)-binding domain-containing protein n=1 Tax=Potamilus streckersoni TaxID=2493646 RepID=A0AAE0VJF0_9BIVA|nr:hypothetical protein CHS0354_001212 [Potamilus streckersoni]
MKFAVLGATGPTGQEFVKEALDKGHSVIALVRSPEKLTTIGDRLKVVKVDIFKEEDLLEHFKDSDAVISCLGCRPSFLGLNPITFYTDSIKPIVGALRKANGSRLICMTASCTKSEPGNPFIIEWVLKPLFLGNTLKNMSEMEDYLAINCLDLDYTVVKPPALKNAQSTGALVKTFDGQYVAEGSGQITRRDVAKFMLTCAVDRLWIKKFVAVSF